MSWEAFVRAHGKGVTNAILAQIVDQPEADIARIKASGACSRGLHRDFASLFSLFHGRAPCDEDWPAPPRSGRGYQWFAPELALLASLVGQMPKPAISAALTARLRALTGDPHAKRDLCAVQNAIGRIGLQTSDLVGGLTVSEAARQAGSRALIYHALENGSLTKRTVGRLLKIDRAEFASWLKSRFAVPPGHVRLSTLKGPLGIRSDKLPEFAKAGLVPNAIQDPTSRIWYVPQGLADQLVADRRAGRPMPWHGKSSACNLNKTWTLLQQRWHPDDCAQCRQIWGAQGRPRDYADYAARYPSLARGAKRHLTRPWSEGLTPKDVAEHCRVSLSRVHKALRNGTLTASRPGRISLTDATRWRARRCPTGDAARSWIDFKQAEAQYGFSPAELERWIQSGHIASRECRNLNVPVVQVTRQQCAELRQTLGYSLEEAARRVGVSADEFTRLAAELDWRAADKIPLAVVQNALTRKASCHGLSIDEAARHLGRTPAWIEAHIKLGTVRVLRSPWQDRRYLSHAMLDRLRNAGEPRSATLSDQWVLLSQAAKLAGVSVSTMNTWGAQGLVQRQRQRHANCMRYHTDSVKAQARAFWAHRATLRRAPPDWIQSAQQSSL